MSARIIVLGNQKGGTGKSTLAMHLAVSLLWKGYKVATVDVDARQGTFTRYVENRGETKQIDSRVLMPFHTALLDSSAASKSEDDRENSEALTKLLSSLSGYDYIVVDTPGSDSGLSRAAHSFADVIITPVNESFIDLDLLVQVGGSSATTLKPSVYAEVVWNQKKERAVRDRGQIDWVVLVNRMPNVISKNRQEFEKILLALSKRIGYRIATGFKERVIFRELFRTGLTLLDRDIASSQTSLSHIAARQELKDLLTALNIVDANHRPASDVS
ncbi:MAG: division plane positioning ATPase MipZ [Holosporales bacterium]|jgi:chromosome partitioning protein|nr:division plane positioning ATPase MipZ [Holosporales bacterium]